MTLWVTLWPVLSCHLVRSPSPRPRHPASPTAEPAAGAGALTLLAASGEVTGALLRFYLLTESISYQKFTKAIVGSPFLNYNTLVRKDQGKNCRNYGRGSRKSQVSLTRKKYTLMLS